MGNEPAGLRFQLVPETSKGEFRQIFYTYLREIAAYYGEWLAHDDYVYPHFEAYWNEPDMRWPYAILAPDGCLAGFALVRLMEDGCTEIAEFGICKAYRNQGVGTFLLQEILTRHTGCLRLDYVVSNTAAENFWHGLLQGRQGWRQQPLEHEGHMLIEFRYRPV